MRSVSTTRTAQLANPGESGLPQITPVMRQAMVDTARLPQTFSRLYVWTVTVGGTLCCALLAIFIQWLLYDHWRFQPFHGLRWGTSLVMVPVVAAMLRLLMYQEQRRRERMINRLLVVAEANHHIRNALTILAAANCYLYGEERRKTDLDLPKTYAVMQESIERIERTLAEVLPQVNEKD